MKIIAALFMLTFLLPSCALYELDRQTAPHFETAKQKADRQAAEVARYLNTK